MIVLVLALVVLGPKRLPQAGRSLGQGLRDFRRGLSGVVDERELAEPSAEPVTPALEARPSPSSQEGRSAA